MILTTGGTIEKTYDERDGSLRNYHSILPKMLSTLRLPDLDIAYEQVVFKDSLEMTASDDGAFSGPRSAFLQPMDSF